MQLRAIKNFIKAALKLPYRWKNKGCVTSLAWCLPARAELENHLVCELTT